MAKKIIQDIYVVKKSIRNIKKSDVRDGFYSSANKKINEKEYTNDLVNKFPIKEENTVYHNEYQNEEKKHLSKDSLIFLWIVCIIVIATSLFLMSSIFATATLTITPKNQSITLNDSFNIYSDKNTSGLHYQVMTINKDSSKSLDTDGEEYIETKAVGKVVLYNNYSTSNQRLIINTRIQTSSGLVYKTRESVNVPGIKTIAGVKTPGSVEVEVIADEAGDKYNMKLNDFKGDFTIPGFKGSTKYSGFYARQSSDITGGFMGNVKKVSDASITTVRVELKDTLNTDLIKEVYSKVPAQYILFKNDYYINCTDTPYDPTNKEYKISESCSINAVIFNKEELSSFIAKNKIADFDNSKVDILWNDNDSIILTGNTEKPWNETTLKVKFAGSALVVWSYDASTIINSILGQDKSVISMVIDQNRSSLKEIQANIRPMWRTTFPTNESKIKVVDTILDAAK